MYLTGHVSIDPSQLTDMYRTKPTKAFGRIAYYLTAGRLSEKEEHETFCALTILQQLFVVLRSLGIDNIVRLAKDEVAFYHDEEGKEGDLKEALDHFHLEVDQVEADVFGRLEMVLEHTVDELQCLLDVAVDRVHKHGEDPISIRVNALIKPFKALGPEETAADAKRRLEPYFSAQERYDDLIVESQSQFDRFLGEIQQSIRKHMRVDSVTVKSDVRVVRPKARLTNRADIGSIDDARDPIYRGYYGYDDYMFYTWLWADMCHDHHIHVHDTIVVDPEGAEVMSVGATGFDAGEGNALDVDAPFEPPSEGDVEIFGANDYVADTDTLKVAGDVDDGGSSWLGSFFDGGGDGDAGDSGGGCSSCGGCGGD